MDKILTRDQCVYAEHNRIWPKGKAAQETDPNPFLCSNHPWKAVLEVKSNISVWWERKLVTPHHRAVWQTNNVWFSCVTSRLAGPFFSISKGGSHYVAQDGLELMTPMPGIMGTQCHMQVGANETGGLIEVPSVACL